MSWSSLMRGSTPIRASWNWPGVRRLTAPLRVTAWRILGANIPEAKDERVAWLDETWCRVDEWVDGQLTVPGQ